MVASLVEAASLPERLGRLTLADDRAKPVSSNVAHAKSSALEATVAAAEAKHVSSVKRVYVTTPLKDIDRVSTLPFLANADVHGCARRCIYVALDTPCKRARYVYL